MLVIRGEAGIGKTALLGYCARRASDCRVVQISGAEAEFDLPFAALHQLCGSMLDGVTTLPEPQDRALRVAFGLEVGSPPDRFLVGLAVLSVLAEVAAKRPVVCLIDDAQWLDEASSQVLAFVGRRLLAEAVALLFAVREGADQRLFSALPSLTLEGLTEEDSRALLAASIPSRLDDHVRDRIVAETCGNPLGLLELPRGMTAAELAGGFGVPTGTTVPSRIEDEYLRRIKALPESTQRLLVIAAADATGDSTLLWRAMHSLGVGRDAAAAARAERLLDLGSSVRFRHPLVRSAAYAAATQEERSAAHLALATATNPHTDPERRVWHLAAAATGLDEDLASQLEQAAGKAEGRAGLSAAAAFLQRAVALTPDPVLRADRALAAAQAHLHAGAFDSARDSLAEAAATAVGDLQIARVEQLNGHIEAVARPGAEAPARLLHAATRLEALDVGLARETYLQAWWAAVLAGRLAAAGADLSEVSRAALSAASLADPRPCDLLLDGLATLVTEGRAAAAPRLRVAVDMYLADQVSADDWTQWSRSATTAALALWDVEGWAGLSTRQVELARSSGALNTLVLALNLHGIVAVSCGDFETATLVVAEQDAVRQVTGAHMMGFGARLLAAYQGRAAELSRQRAADGDLVERGEGTALEIDAWAIAVLNNGLGRYGDALTAARGITWQLPIFGNFALSELIEAAVRTGEAALGNDALRQLSFETLAGSDWAAGIESRGRALVSSGDAAEDAYKESIGCLTRTPLRPELARSHLLYGEWLRRENRRVDAREHLRTAYEMLAAMGADAFAERARRELLATGEKVRKREVDTRAELTPQEEHIARLARDGRTNAEIGAELFISARTVEWHLRKVFLKLGISSRRDLHDTLPTRGR